MQASQLNHPTSSPNSSLTRWLKPVLDFIGSLWERLSPSESIQVWRSQDPQGTIYWNAYDPNTGRQITVTTQEELIAWIEGADAEVWRHPEVTNPFLYPLSNRYSPHL